MRPLKTLLAASVAFAAIAAAPANANDTDLIRRLLDSLVTDRQLGPREEIRRRSWNDDDDDGYRRGWNDDDDDGRSSDDDHEDGGDDDDD